jgi:hypothetical protein
MVALRNARTRKRRKICRCDPTCYKFLAYSTRLQHYKTADESLILPSESGSEDLSTGDTPELGSTHEEVSIDLESSSISDPELQAIEDYQSPPPDDSVQNTCVEMPDFVDLNLGTLEEIYDELVNMLGPHHEAEMWRIRESRIIVGEHQLTEIIIGNKIINDDDRDNIRAFKLKMFSNMPRRMFNQVRHTFRHKCAVNSEWVMIRRIAILSGIEPMKIDCCINTCIAYTGKYELREDCPFCHESRYTRDRKPRRTFLYIPLIPRLQSFYQNKSIIKLLSYRHCFEHQPDRIRDVFDSQHYRQLLRRKVKVDGVERPYTFFSDRRDIAFALSLDGYLLFKRRRSGPSAMPILLVNYNLPPKICNHCENLLCLGVIHNPKDLASYLVPFEDECVKLAMGVRTFDANEESAFLLHAYAVMKHGDIVAIERMMGLRGHNGVRPCRSCTIKGVRNISRQGKTYYVPLTTPDVEAQTRPSVNPYALPPRTHDGYVSTLERWESAGADRQDDIGKRHGIRRPPVLRRVSSIDYGVSCPWEWLHLFAENAIPNMRKHWTGQFKGLDTGTESYKIEDKVWQQIGIETMNAVKEIPSSYVRVLGDIYKDSGNYTAESWAFWFMYVAPIVLKGRFQDEKYYDHMCLLVKVMKKTLLFELTLEEIDEIEWDLVHWVQLYEE